MKIGIVIAIVVGLFASSCLRNEYQGLQEFEKHMNDADKYQISGLWLDAETSYLKAINAAELMNWGEGVVSAKTGLSWMYFKQKKNVEAIRTMTEAKDLCKVAPNCIGLNNLYDSLFNIYLDNVKDRKQAEAIILELEADQSVLGERFDVVQKISDFRSRLGSSNIYSAPLK